ncbi:hypothetical protein WN944_022184 [Citrus x changshan-huyou]|uniref:Uncharacterized protein n=1 Tax=Citrus x changshan-huyou TaxID=2935761 RepID=A0AAP0MY13_9ROSI
MEPNPSFQSFGQKLDLKYLYCWRGTNCDVRRHRVTALNISDFGLRGTIPLQLGNLSALGTIDLSHSQLPGELPQKVGNLAELKRCKNLKVLALSDNPINGVLPSSIGDLSLSFTEIYFSNSSIRGFTRDWKPNQLDSVGFSGQGVLKSPPNALKANKSTSEKCLLMLKSARPMPDQIFTPTDAGGFAGVNPPMPKLAQGVYRKTRQLSGSPSWDFNCYIVGNRGISCLPRRFWEMRNYRDSVKSCFRSLGDGSRLGICFWSVYFCGWYSSLVGSYL